METASTKLVGAAGDFVPAASTLDVHEPRGAGHGGAVDVGAGHALDREAHVLELGVHLRGHRILAAQDDGLGGAQGLDRGAAGAGEPGGAGQQDRGAEGAGQAGPGQGVVVGVVAGDDHVLALLARKGLSGDAGGGIAGR